MDYAAYELGEGFMERPTEYYLIVPSKWHLNWLIRRSVRRAARRQPTVATIQLKRPLSDVTGYVSILKMDQQDYDWVLPRLQAYLNTKGLEASNLTLEQLKKVDPGGEFEEPYDLVTATFTLSAIDTHCG